MCWRISLFVIFFMMWNHLHVIYLYNAQVTIVKKKKIGIAIPKTISQFSDCDSMRVKDAQLRTFGHINFFFFVSIWLFHFRYNLYYFCFVW